MKQIHVDPLFQLITKIHDIFTEQRTDPAALDGAKHNAFIISGLDAVNVHQRAAEKSVCIIVNDVSNVHKHV